MRTMEQNEKVNKIRSNRDLTYF